MIDEREELERAARRFSPEVGIVDRVYRRRDRKRRNRRIGSAALALIIAGVAIGGLVLAFRSPMPRPTDEQIMVPRAGITRGAVRGFRLLGLQGQQLGEIPNLPRRATELSVSPDGRMIAFSRHPYAGIWTIGVDGTNLKRVGRQQTTAPSWAPDGSTITSFAAGQVFTVGADGSDPSSFRACGAYWGSLIAHPKWSPDGDKILCSWLSGRPGPSRLHVHVVSYNPALDPVRGPDRYNQRPAILAGGEGVNAWDGDWSPDGERIAFSRAATGRHFDIETADPRFDIWVMDADGSNQRPLVEGGDGAEVGPFWSPDGRMVAYTSVRETRTVWIVDVASGETRRVGPGTVFGWLTPTTLVVGGSD